MSDRWWFSAGGSSAIVSPPGVGGTIGDDRIATLAGADETYTAYARTTPGDGLVEAWLTLKRYPEATDVADGSAPLRKIVTTTNVPGSGQITSDGATSGRAVIRFDLSAANTTALGQRDYAFDVKVKAASGREFFVARGLWTNSGVSTLSA